MYETRGSGGAVDDCRTFKLAKLAQAVWQRDSVVVEMAPDSSDENARARSRPLAPSRSATADSALC